MKFAIVHGPNLNWLGRRETQIYGSHSWEMIWEQLIKWSEKNSSKLVFFQSNSEGALIDYLQSCDNEFDGILLNPGAYTHTSIALRDCVACLRPPVVEVHFSNIYLRESFRHCSYIAEVAKASILGFGKEGYFLGLELLQYLVQYEFGKYDHPQQR